MLRVLCAVEVPEAFRSPARAQTITQLHVLTCFSLNKLPECGGQARCANLQHLQLSQCLQLKYIRCNNWTGDGGEREVLANDARYAFSKVILKRNLHAITSALHVFLPQTFSLCPTFSALNIK